MRLFPLTLLFAVLLAAGCRQSSPPRPEEQLSASALPAITIKPDKKLLLTYAAAEGGFATVDELEKVPDQRRGWVRVVDLDLPPERRKDHELVYVADLRSAHEDGSYPYVVMSRAAFEAAAVGRPQAGASDAPSSQPAQAAAGSAAGHAAGTPAVILYSTSWCGACRAARAYLTDQGIPFVEKDIEKDPQAAAELLSKAKAAGISASGVPVIEVKGTLMQGFNPQRLTALLGENK